MTGKLDIFELSPDTEVVTTIADLRRLYSFGFVDGELDYDEDHEVYVHGDIV